MCLLTLFTFKSYLTTQPPTCKFLANCFSYTHTHTELSAPKLFQCQILELLGALPSTFNSQFWLSFVEWIKPYLSFHSQKTPQLQHVMNLFWITLLYCLCFHLHFCSQHMEWSSFVTLHFDMHLLHSYWKCFDLGFTHFEWQQQSESSLFNFKINKI